jgi:hypothetical protein
MSWLLPDATPENLKTIDWIGPYVSDEGQGMASVHALLVETPDLVIGTYFAGPTAGRLVRDGGVYRLA